MCVCVCVCVCVCELYTGTCCRVRTSEGVSDVFEVKSGVRQGCVLSPLLFNAYMDKIVRDATSAYEGGLQVEYTTSGGLFLTYRDKTPANTCVPNIQYADDLTVCAESRSRGPPKYAFGAEHFMYKVGHEDQW